MNDPGTIVFQLVFAIIVAVVAHSRGRSPLGWAVLGFLFSCFALVLVIVLPDVNLEDERRAHLERENRRLAEQLRKERQVADVRHAETVGRLGAHDAVLGLDTAGTVDPRVALETDDVPPELPPPPPRGGRAATITSLRWHYAVDGETGTEGPVPFDEIRELWDDGVLDPRSLLWSKGMTDWATIAELRHVRDELERRR